MAGKSAKMNEAFLAPPAAVTRPARSGIWAALRARLGGYWPCQIIGWSAFGILQFLLYVLFNQSTWAKLPALLGSAGIGLICSHGLRLFIRRQRWVALPLKRLLPRILLAIMVTGAVIDLLSIGWFLYICHVITPADLNLTRVAGMFINWSSIVLVWSLIYFSVHYFWRFRQAEVARWQVEANLREAELRALKSQLNPHFIFNSLNGIRALIAEDPDRAQRMVTHLASLLRESLRTHKQALVPLEQELKSVRNYLELESIRLEERLRYRIEVAPDVLEEPVPIMLLQMLVENGVKHGVANLPEGGEITLSARRRGKSLELRVTNSGQLQPHQGGTGLGMPNIIQRLALHYGERANFSLYNATRDRVLAELCLPTS